MSTLESPDDIMAERSGILSRQLAMSEAQNFLLSRGVIVQHPALRALQSKIHNCDIASLVSGLEIVMHDYEFSGLDSSTFDWSHGDRDYGSAPDNPSGLFVVQEEEPEENAGGTNPYVDYHLQQFPGGIAPGILSDVHSYTDCSSLDASVSRTIETHYRIADGMRGKFALTLHFPSFVPLLQVCEDSPECAMRKLEQIADYYNQDDPHDYLHRYLAMYLAARIGSMHSAFGVQAIESSANPYHDMIPDYGSGYFDPDVGKAHARALWRMAIARNPALVSQEF